MLSPSKPSELFKNAGIQSDTLVHNRKQKKMGFKDSKAVPDHFTEEDMEFNTKLALKQLELDKQTKLDYKYSLQTFVVFLVAAINFGNSFCGNS